jgi:hypothetical protein
MLEGISNLEWNMVENLVNCSRVLFTGIEWHSKFAIRLCKIGGAKPHRAYVKVVEGSEIYNFGINTSMHFSCKKLSKALSNEAAPKRVVPERNVVPLHRVPTLKSAPPRRRTTAGQGPCAHAWRWRQLRTRP